MKLPVAKIRRYVLVGVPLLLLCGLLAPYLSANRFGDRIRLALETSLHRKVEIESAGFNLFRGPGFTLRGVVIHEDPAIGLEPFAYVDALEARVRLLSLLRGRLEFSALRLDSSSVNLVKTPGGPWNFQQLLGQSTAARLPSIFVRNGRVNLKSGDVKSVFYLNAADLDLRPSRTAGGPVSFEFSGEPTRSDRTARGFGTIRGRGQWRPSPDGGSLDLQIEVERSSMGELVALVHGHDVGVHGQVAAEIRIRGPLSALDISGTLQLSEIHRWDLLPPYARGGPLDFRGKLDLLSHDLDIETVQSESSALSVRVHAADYLTRPRWVVGLTFNGFPVGPVVDIARHMGAGLPDDLQFDGAIYGAFLFSPADGFRGTLSLDGMSIGTSGSPQVRFEGAQLVLDGERLRMDRGLIAVGDEGEKASVSMEFLPASQQLDLKLTTESMSIAALQAEAGPLPGVPRPDLMNELRGGAWSGSLRFRKQPETEGTWSGNLNLRETRLVVPGMAEPLEIAAASVKLDGGSIEAEGRASAGGIEIRGSYRGRPQAKRPHRFTLRASAVTGSELARLMAPTLQRPRGFISRTLRLSRGSVPEWLRSRHAEGTLELGSLRLAGQEFDSVRLRFFWDGPVIEVPRFQARAVGGSVEGYLSMDLMGPEPLLKMAGRLESASWRGGEMDADTTITTSGIGDELFWNLEAEGNFRLRGAELAEKSPTAGMSGAWALRYLNRHPRLRLYDLRLADGREVFTGQGTTTEDDRLLIELSNTERQLHLAGTLKPFRLELMAGR